MIASMDMKDAQDTHLPKLLHNIHQLMATLSARLECLQQILLQLLVLP